MTNELITWIPCDTRLPDADLNVLVFNAENETAMEAFLDGEDDDGSPLWRDVTALQLHHVTHWAEMPRGPGR